MNSTELPRFFAVLEEVGGGQKYRVMRGGSWADDDPNYLLSSFRYFSLPGERIGNVGFRVVLADVTENN